MIPEQDIEIKRFIYELPESKIARYPLPDRESSRMLVFRNGKITDDIFGNLTDHLNKGHLLVFNNTRVIRARLKFRKTTGSAIEIFCLEPSLPTDYSVSFSSYEPVEWKCLVGNSKKWKSGSLMMKLGEGSIKGTLSAERVSGDEHGATIRFSWDNKELCFSEILQLVGHVPVPPYLAREDEEVDTMRYQTLYSRHEGSVAAPTAGLHFGPQVLGKLKNLGIQSEEITLHVGAGTFIPVKSEKIGGHTMHTEHFTASKNSISNLAGQKVIAVGTTSARTLESLYWLGLLIFEKKIVHPGELDVDQWVPYEKRDYLPATDEALDALTTFMERFSLNLIYARTSIIIVPGYRFRIVTGLITNWHMPGSTLLLLVSALIGDKWREIYNHALENGYRFLSYGDSSLLLPG